MVETTGYLTSLPSHGGAALGKLGLDPPRSPLHPLIHPLLSDLHHRPGCSFTRTYCSEVINNAMCEPGKRELRIK
jgi:hypothetical protein